mmetsp:Transcript_27175/g.48782  ORF Transcript_27175/g.48782 Transcript_27175/m.48782 type:complete len:245 (+) Transcript_27175:52-786(+)
MSKNQNHIGLELASSSFFMTGNEAPICKGLKPSQIYSDYRTSPLRMSGSLVLNGILPKPTPAPSVLSEHRAPSIDLARKSTRRLQKAPLQTLSSDAAFSTTLKPILHRDFKARLRESMKKAASLMELQSDKIVLRCKSEDKLKKSNRSDFPLEALNSNHSHIENAGTENRTMDQNFVPYSIKDYRKMKNSSKKKLGGLGPASIGSIDWEAKAKKMSRMAEYSQKVVLPKLSAYQDRSKSCLKFT